MKEQSEAGPSRDREAAAAPGGCRGDIRMGGLGSVGRIEEDGAGHWPLHLFGTPAGYPNGAQRSPFL